MSEIPVEPIKKNRSLTIILLVLIPLLIGAGIFIYAILDTYVISPMQQKNMSPDQLLCDRLGVWNKGRETKSGVTAIKKLDEAGNYDMWYNFYPVGTQSTDDELAVKIAKDLIKTFMDKDALNELKVTVCLPYRDEYLNTVWRPYVSFEMNRNKLAKYNYSNFVSSDLYTVAENVVRYENNK